MKNSKPSISLNDVIAPENIQLLGEYLAINALNFLRPYRAVEQCYRGLLQDIRNKNKVGYRLSDGYDFAQTAMCFLCKYMGKSLGDIIIGKNGKPATVKQECYRVINRMTAQNTHYKNNTLPIHKTIVAKRIQPFSDETYVEERSYARAQNIIENMELTEKQAKTLEYYMEGKSTGEISRLLSVAAVTVWRYRTAVRQKYMALTEL